MAQRPLKPGDLLKITVTAPVEAEDAVARLLERSFRQPVALYTDEETLRTEVSIFLASPRLWNAARREQLERGLRRLRTQGVPLGRTRLRSARLPHRDWAEAWKRHFKPIEIADTLLVLPTWSRRRPLADQAVVRLDPGLSFGTGQHPTTAFCLEQIVACRPGGSTADVAVGAPTKTDNRKSLLDIGCGSGILAIAAAKLGYQPVVAFDLDPDAVRVAKENTAQNGVTMAVEVGQSDLTRLPTRPKRRFDVVCANLLADLLQAQVGRITGCVSPGGTLVVAGILTTEFDQVCHVYQGAGWRLVADKAVKEWRSGAFTQEPKHRSSRDGRQPRTAAKSRK